MANVFYLMGASGSQKDTLINALKTLITNDSLMIAPRYRAPLPAHIDRNDIGLSSEEFQRRSAMQRIIFRWEANGNSYGLGSETEAWLALGQSVLVKGSRESLKTAKAHFGKTLVPILIHADNNLLRSQMLQSGTASSSEIEARLIRAQAYVTSLAPHCHLIKLERDINKTIQALETLIRMHLNTEKNHHEVCVDHA
ncbi:hypothetical protein [Neptunomonas marina]|uniref:Guanylate kinase/L-type calcium channel beta subunit domain-containing protein n=1 Tax=Neptunomonas marina TaxID=1815562 RepID=A0A437Q4B7_9GAMM|nr:hypothetical protein [Neptunomonas marina]RVU29367.1 hypothetical protein EOE65_16480 [Neptunomonas marina]